MTDPIFAPPTSDLRVVLLTTTGPYAGLHQIQGRVSEIAPKNEPLPELVPDVPFLDGHRGMAGLIKFTPRYVLYKEVSGPTMHSYNRTTGKDHFDPSQR
jgi:hypothetical protein